MHARTHKHTHLHTRTRARIRAHSHYRNPPNTSAIMPVLWWYFCARFTHYHLHRVSELVKITNSEKWTGKPSLACVTTFTGLRRLLWVNCHGHAGVMGSDRADRLAEQSNRHEIMAFFSEELKCWWAWDTTCRNKAKDITPSIVLKDRRTKRRSSTIFHERTREVHITHYQPNNPTSFKGRERSISLTIRRTTRPLSKDERGPYHSLSDEQPDLFQMRRWGKRLRDGWSHGPM